MAGRGHPLRLPEGGLCQSGWKPQHLLLPPRGHPGILGEREGLSGPPPHSGQASGRPRCCFGAVGTSCQEAAHWLFPRGKADPT